MNMSSADLAIIGVDDGDSSDVARMLAQKPDPPKIRRISVSGEADAEVVVDESGTMRDGSREMDLSPYPTLRGRHNWQNAACAAVVANALAIPDEAVDNAMRSFPGLEHRMEIIGQRGKVLFINDSKATNPDAAGRALSAFEPVYWIAGGKSGDGGISELQESFGRIAKAYLIGDAAAGFSAELSGRVPHVIAGDLTTAVSMAAADAALDGRPEPVVLLSPACKSFDQFKDFAARGDAFRARLMAMQQNGTSKEALS